MNPSHDPNLTSWALNELSPSERAAYEEQLKKNPAIQAEAETTQSFCRFIQNHLRDDRAALTDAQRARLQSTAAGHRGRSDDVHIAGGKAVKPQSRIWWQNPSILLPLSAAAAITLAMAPYLSRKSAPQTAGESSTALVAIATPKPEPTHLVLSPSLAQDQTAGAPVPDISPFHPVKLVADVEAKLKASPSAPLEIDVAKLKDEASEPARIIKTSASSLSLGGREGVVTRTFASQVSPAPAGMFSGLIVGSGGVTLAKSGAVTFTISGSNTFTGGTVVIGGTTQFGYVRGEVARNRLAFNDPASQSPDQLGVGRGFMKASTVTPSEGDVTLNSPGFRSSGATQVKSGAGTMVSPDLALAPVPTNQAMPSARGDKSEIRELMRQTPSSTPSLVGAQEGTKITASGFVRTTVGPPAGADVFAPGAEMGVFGGAIFPRKTVNADAPMSMQAVKDDLLSRGPNLMESEIELTRTAGEKRSTESYAAITENTLTEVAAQPLSTFSIDVDTASYANVRRFLNSGQRPPVDAVRIEEMINYFPYDYEFPQRGEAPFTVAAAVAEAPWSPTHRLARIAIKARDVGMAHRPGNFVFLVDVSGSMSDPNKLPLVQQSLGLLTDQLAADDRVAIVVYAGGSGLVLPSTSGDKKPDIRRVISEMKAGGSTHGSAGIREAYVEAQRSFIKEGVNRVILCTDGDFNVGISSTPELEKLIAEKAKGGVFLSVLGFGTGNTKDTIMETLADKGNGNYAYIDSLSEARKVLVDQMRGTLIAVAKDVKIQVEFNPTLVRAYRLIGYENRVLAKEDFNNDAKDAGEIGAGHTVTALYEIVPVGAASPDGRPVVDGLKYQSVPAAAPSDAAKSGEMMTVKLRFKKPDGDKSELIDFPVKDEGAALKDSEREFKFAVSVAGFGLLLRNSSYKGEMTWDDIRKLALASKGEDPNGYRGEFIQLIDKAHGILGDGRP